MVQLSGSFLPRSLAVTSKDMKFAKHIPLLLFLWALPFAAKAQFTFITNGNAITITGYTGTNGNVVIPDIISGLPVTSIRSSAFEYKNILTNITIPGSITNIGGSAFYNCGSLTNVTLSEGLASIG